MTSETVTETSVAFQGSLPAAPVELRSALPLNDREVMPEASSACQGNGLTRGDLTWHDRIPAHAHADVWRWLSLASQPCGWNLDLCQANRVDRVHLASRVDHLDCESGCEHYLC